MHAYRRYQKQQGLMKTPPIARAVVDSCSNSFWFSVILSGTCILLASEWQAGIHRSTLLPDVGRPFCACLPRQGPTNGTPATVALSRSKVSEGESRSADSVCARTLLPPYHSDLF